MVRTCVHTGNQNLQFAPHYSDNRLCAFLTGGGPQPSQGQPSGGLNLEKKLEKLDKIEKKKKKRERDGEVGPFPPPKLAKFAGAMGPPFSAATKPLNLQSAMALAAQAATSAKELPSTATATASAAASRSSLTLNIKQGGSSFKRSTSDTSIKVAGNAGGATKAGGGGGGGGGGSGTNSPTFMKAASISPKFGGTANPAKHLMQRSASPNRVGSPVPSAAGKGERGREP